MICVRRGELAETEEHGEICAVCLQDIQQENHRQFGRVHSQGQDGYGRLSAKFIEKSNTMTTSVAKDIHESLNQSSPNGWP